MSDGRGTFTIGRNEDIAWAIALCAQLGDAELLRAVRCEVINLEEVARGALVPTKILEESLLSMITIIGRDDLCFTGPAAWPATRRLFRWAPAAMIHGSGADASAYQMVVAMALQCGRFC